MQKFSEINEGKVFITDPSIIKKYAAFVMPLYIIGKIKCDENLLDEYLDLYKKQVKSKNTNVVCDLEVAAVRLVIQENPMNQTGFDILKKEIADKCPRLEKFLRSYIIDPKNYTQ